MDTRPTRNAMLARRATLPAEIRVTVRRELEAAR